METRTSSEVRKVPPPIAAKPPNQVRSKSSAAFSNIPHMAGRLSSTRKTNSTIELEDVEISENSPDDHYSSTLSLSGSSGGDCPKHPHEKLKYHCQFHDELVCADCLAMDAKHQGHRHIRAEEMVKDYRTNLKAQMLPLNELEESAQTALTCMDQRKKELMANGTSVKEQVRNRIAQLTATLDSREVILLEEVDRMVSKKMQQHNAHETYLESLIGEMHSLIETGSKVANENSTNILYVYKELSQEILEKTRKFRSLPKDVFQPLQGPNISFIPDYSLDEAFNIAGTISERQPDPAQSSFNKSSALTVDKEAIVHLVLKDSDGRPYCEHVSCLNLEVVSTADNSKVNFSFEQDKTNRNQYNVTFTPHDDCHHLIKAKIGNTAIRNSPLEVPVNSIIECQIVGEIKGVLQPWGLALTDNNEMVVVENGKDCVSIHSMDGKGKSRAITGKGNKKLTRPRGVVVSRDNRLLITDEEGLKQCTLEGKQMTVIGKPGSAPLEFNTPNGITIDKDNMIYVCDTFNSRIQVLDSDLGFLGFMGSDGPKEICVQAPYDIALNSAGTFYVADYNDHAIKMYSKLGEFLGQIETKGNNERLKNPVCVHVNHKDHVFVGEEKGNGVCVFDSNGKFLTVIPVRLNGCHGITSDIHGQLYICDRANRRIIIYK